MLLKVFKILIYLFLYFYPYCISAVFVFVFIFVHFYFLWNQPQSIGRCHISRCCKCHVSKNLHPLVISWSVVILVVILKIFDVIVFIVCLIIVTIKAYIWHQMAPWTFVVTIVAIWRHMPSVAWRSTHLSLRRSWRWWKLRWLLSRKNTLCKGDDFDEINDDN